MENDFISSFWYEDRKNFKNVWFKVNHNINNKCKFIDGSYWFCCNIHYKVLKYDLEPRPAYLFKYRMCKKMPLIFSVKYIDD